MKYADLTALINYAPPPQKKILFFPEMWVTKKVLTRAAAKKIVFYQFN